MLKNKFLIKDFFPADAAKYISGVLMFFIFTLSLMSFTKTGNNDNGKKPVAKDSVASISTFQNLIDNNISNVSSVIALNPEASFFFKKFPTASI